MYCSVRSIKNAAQREDFVVGSDKYRSETNLVDATVKHI